MKPRPLIFAKRWGAPVAPLKNTEEIARRMTEVVQQAYTKPFSLQSDFARTNSFFVAAAASLGYITTRTSPRSFSYGHLWRTTGAGLKFVSDQ